MAKLKLNYPNIEDERGQLHSISDPTEYITFGPWIYMVPQYRPKSILMLGYGGGTTAKLIRMFHGEVPITAVDFSDVSEFLIDGVEWVNQNARDYVKNCGKFDAVIIDLFDTDDFHPQPFVYGKQFADDLGRIANYVILHSVVGDDTSAYGAYRKIRSLNMGRTDEFAPEFHYYMVNEVNIPVR